MDEVSIFTNLLPNFGLGARDRLGQVVEDSFKIAIVTNNLSIHEVDVRKLRTEIEAKSHLGQDMSSEKLENHGMGASSSDPFLENQDGEGTFAEGSFSFLKKMDNKPILRDFMRFLKKSPDLVKTHLDVERNLYIAIFGQKMLIADLKRLKVEGGVHEARDLVHIGFFQRTELSKTV
jgi:hypothetical protein